MEKPVTESSVAIRHPGRDTFAGEIARCHVFE